MRPVTEQWFAERTFQYPAWTAECLVAAKAGRRVSVVLPALDEEETVGAIVAAIVPLTRGPAPLVDELVVVDSGSTDRTVEVAAAAGARVVHRGDVVPELAPRPGKGEVLWRSLAATTGDVVVFLDSDLVDFDPAFVPSLLGPILTVPGVALVKGFYRRPLRLETPDDESLDHGGGRVTELLARPLLAALRPELSGVVQPLGGEYAATRALLESVPFAPGYGVEIGLLLDTHARLGLAGLAQVNLGVRKHRNRSLLQLGVMARQILGAALRRCGDGLTDSGAPLTQFLQIGGEWLPASTEVEVAERPPMRTVLAQRDLLP
jgi:glucosyl-3-phosphoglycerate synthase